MLCQRLDSNESYSCGSVMCGMIFFDNEKIRVEAVIIDLDGTLIVSGTIISD